MSASGYTPIQLYRTSTAAAVPSASNLASGELAINLTDEKLYFKNAFGVVTLLASSGGAVGTVSSVDASGGTTGLTFSGGPITTSGTLTLAGTLGVANGGTGATSLTSGYLVKGNGTSALSSSQWYDDGTNVGLGVVPSTSWNLGYPVIQMGSSGQAFVYGGGNVAAIATNSRYQSGWKYVLSNFATQYFQDSGQHKWLTAPSGTAGTAISFTQAMTLNASGGLSVGTTTDPGASNIGLAAGGKVQYSSSAYITPENNVSGAEISTPGAITFKTGTGPTERARIDSSGNVGIGTTSLSAGYGAGKSVMLTNQSSVLFQNASNTWNTTTAGGAVTYYSDNNLYIDAKDSASNIMFRVNGATERMRIDSSGNVGIGTSSPYSRFTVVPSSTPTTVAGANQITVGESTANSAYRLQIGYLNNGASGYNGSIQVYDNGNAQSLILNGAGGNVGIGTASPSTKLQVNGAGFIAALISSDSTSETQLRFSTNTAARVSNQANTALIFDTNATERMRIDSSGNVGIGTSSPGQKLTVAGTIESTSGGIKYPDGTTQTTGALEQVDVYTTVGSTTWTKPSWAKAVIVILIGGGGGGGSGRKGAAGTVRTGGAGGGGGAYSTNIFNASDLTSTVTVTVGGGGSGGTAISANSTNGNAGNNGGNTSFGTYIYAMGGTGGGAGSTGSTGAGTGGIGTVGSSSAANNGATTGNAAQVFATIAAQSGGAGGPITAGNTVVAGGQGCNTTSGTPPRWKSTTLNTPGTSVVAGDGNSGTDNTAWLGGESGDGGGASGSGNAGNGGNGGKWGGGGGGGGAAVDSVGNSGAGGNGANGIVVVISQG